MTKDEVLSLPSKCEINVDIVEDARQHGRRMESVLTTGEMKKPGHSERYPAFEGAIRVPVTLEFGGKKCKRLFRVKYSYTPDWEYYDPETKQLIKGWESWTRRHEIWAVPGDNCLDEKPKWISADTFAEPGVLSPAQEMAIDELIDKRCREEDRRRRKAAGVTLTPKRLKAA